MEERSRLGFQKRAVPVLGEEHFNWHVLVRAKERCTRDTVVSQFLVPHIVPTSESQRGSA